MITINPILGGQNRMSSSPVGPPEIVHLPATWQAVLGPEVFLHMYGSMSSNTQEKTCADFSV